MQFQSFQAANNGVSVVIQSRVLFTSAEVQSILAKFASGRSNELDIWCHIHCRAGKKTQSPPTSDVVWQDADEVLMAGIPTEILQAMAHAEHPPTEAELDEMQTGTVTGQRKGKGDGANRAGAKQQ